MYSKLKYVLGSYRFPFVVTACWAVINAMFPALLNPLVIKYLFDEGVIKGNFRFFVVFGLSSVVGFTIWRLSERSCQLFAQKLKNKVLKSRSQSLLEAYHKIPYKKLIKSEEGYFVSRVFDEARNASWPVIEGLFNIFSLSARCLGGMLVSLLLSWQLVLILLAIVMPLSLIAGKFSKRIQHQSKQEQESEARLRNVITQVIRGYKANNVFRLHKTVNKVTEQSWNGYLLSLYKRFKNSATYMTVNGIFMSWAEMGVIIAAGYQVMTGKLTFGGFMGFSNAFWILTGGILQLIDNLPGFYRALAAVDRVVEFENLALAKKSATVAQGKDITLDTVGFSFADSVVLANYELSVKHGEKVLIVGPNGSGKSTLANIVSGFLEPDSGQAIVPNKISSITEPMAFPPVSLEEMLSSVDNELGKVLIDRLDLKGQMTKEYEELSAGQKKKFAVMLAILQKADLYVLDEPLANLDTDSKKIMMELILELTRGNTLIVIMHGDDDFYRYFDRVLTLTVHEDRAV